MKVGSLAELSIFFFCFFTDIYAKPGFRFGEKFWVKLYVKINWILGEIYNCGNYPNGSNDSYWKHHKHLDTFHHISSPPLFLLFSCGIPWYKGGNTICYKHPKLKVKTLMEYLIILYHKMETIKSNFLLKIFETFNFYSFLIHLWL